MKMRESEVFNNYLKLAKDAGLISSDDEIKKTADADTKTRYDRYSFSDLEVLYGHKFEPNKEKDESIVDVAHPETMVVGPAYDAMNAVVENLHQRQDIMSYVALKDPDGHLVQRRYVAAADDLTKTLVSTGFAMDSADEADLMKLADSCASRIAGNIEKSAWMGMAASILLSVGPMIYNYVKKTEAEKTAKAVKTNPKARTILTKRPEAAQNIMKNKAMGRVSKGFRALGWGAVILGAYDMIKNHLIGSWDMGIDKNMDRLISNLGELYQNVPSQVGAPIQAYVDAIENLRKAHNTFNSGINSELSAANDFYSIKEAGNRGSKIDEFNNAKLVFDQETRKFVTYMNAVSEKATSDYEFIQMVGEGFSKLLGSGVKNQIMNDIYTLDKSLDDYITAMQATVRYSEDALKKEEQKAVQSASNVDYVGLLNKELGIETADSAEGQQGSSWS